MSRFSRKSGVIAAAGAFFAAGGAAAIADVIQAQRITPIPRSTSQIFGLSLAFDGTTILAGAGFENSAGFGAGAAYVFQKNGSGNWVQQVRLLAPTPASSEYFGTGVAIDGTTMMIGAPSRTSSGVGDAGEAFAYELQAGSWVRVQTLVSSAPINGGYFGDTIDIEGDLAVIASWTSPFPSAGGSAGREARVFERTGGVWAETAVLAAPRAFSNGFTGSADVEISDGVVYLSGSAELDGGNVVGAVFVYERSGASWQQTATLRPSDGVVSARYGQAVAISGDLVAVTAPNDTIHGLAIAGSVYLYQRTGSTLTEVRKLTAPTPAARDFFGVDVAFDGRSLLVGAYQSEITQPFQRRGYAVLYHMTGSDPGAGTIITASDGEPHDLFGWHVGLSGDEAVITAPMETTNQGAAYVYRGVAPPCPADIDGDGSVGLPDLAALLSNFGSLGGGLSGDLDADGDVDLADLAVLLGAFGSNC
ncbi:MAG: hypothetical protein IT450_11735 [Phycisphaerales bacterium]|nr:hypothetical protein [Phycisphaerales bacterium]